MSWRFHGHARVDPKNPSAFGVCDRCYLLYNLDDLVWQYDYRGNQLENLWKRICRRTCLDKPQDQLRPKALPPDPVPRYQPRPENYASDDQGVSAATVAVPPLVVPED